MSKRSGVFKKGRATNGPFLAVPRAVLDSAAWSAMTGHEIKLLMDVAAQFRGSNNGNLSVAWRILQLRGWKSRDSLSKALTGLTEKGFLIRTRQGGRRICSLYGLSWEPIHDCAGKLDVAANPVPSNAWRAWQPQKIVDTAGGSSRHAGRVNGHTERAPLTRQACQ